MPKPVYFGVSRARGQRVGVRVEAPPTARHLSMDGAHISPYPHLSWCVYELAVQRPRVMAMHECRHVTDRLWLTTDGEATVHWSFNGNDTSYRVGVGSIGFFPSDGGRHAMTITSPVGVRIRILSLPDDHLRSVATAGDLPHPAPFQAIPTFRDVSLRGHLLRLTEAGGGFEVAEDTGADIAAREIVLRLCELLAGVRPDWLKGSSTFPPAVMRQIVDHLDTNLASQVSLTSLCEGLGLSPSHFARKFQHSVGVSVNRFVNRRRIRKAFRSLQDESVALSRLSLDLGFSSQSHFTRVFSGLTGITPMQFRRLGVRPDAP
jgi:AraC-like DNA-binding protein